MHPHALHRPGILAGAFILVAGIAAFAFGLFGASADTGGPGGGYTWFDSNDPGPKIADTPVSLTSPSVLSVTDEDDAWSIIDLDFTFNFFGQDYTQVAISSNGFLSFDVNNTCNDNYNNAQGDSGNTIPVAGGCEASGWGGDPLIAAWFDDLDPGECGAVLSGTLGQAPDRIQVVQYVDVCHQDCQECDSGEGVTFDVLLFEGSNDIKVQYEDTFFGDSDPGLTEENRGGTATVGLSNGSQGLQYSANQTVLTDGLAVLFTTGGLPTPTASPSPAPTPLIQGDVDCDRQVNPIDSLKILRFDAGLSVSQAAGCPPINSDIDVP